MTDILVISLNDDGTLNQLEGRISEFVSLLWTVRPFESSDFELTLFPTDENLLLFGVGDGFGTNRILVLDDANLGYQLYPMMVEKVVLESSVEDGDNLRLSGRDMASVFLSSRIIPQQYNAGTDLQTIAEELLASHFATAGDRYISIIMDEDYPLQGTVEEKQFCGETIYEVLKTYCEDLKLMIVPYVDSLWDTTVETPKLHFMGVSPEDKTSTVMFQPQSDNLISINYSIDAQSYKTTAYVGGEGEGDQQKIEVVAGEETGINRREMWVAYSESSSNEGEITEEEYTTMLQSEGTDKLTDNNKNLQTFDAEVEDGVMYTFGYSMDYFVGDKVSVANNYGIQATGRVSELIISYDDSGRRVYPKFNFEED